MSGGKGGGETEQSTTVEPWRYLAPYLAGGNRVGASQEGRPPIQGIYDLSYEQAQRPMEGAYTFGPSSMAARGSLWNQTRNPSSLESAANNQFQRTIQGDYLTGGPGFDAAYQAGANRVIPQVTSMFSGGGRLNSGLAQTAMTQGLGDVFGGLYNQERTRQTAAAAQYPALQQAQLQRLSVPVSLGESADEMRRQQMFARQNQLSWLGQQLGQTNPGGGTTTAESPSQSSLLGNLLGLGSVALGGYGLWNNLGANTIFGGGASAAGGYPW